MDDIRISHQAIHDAESIFWIILFFMIRANPKGSTDSYESLMARSKAFDVIVRHEIGSRASSRASFDWEWDETLPEELQGFSKALENLSLYFCFP
jgi:hypothetical protein